MPSKVFSAAAVGLSGEIVQVEIDVSFGLRSFTIVGLPDKAVEEAKERVGAAIKSSGFASPHHQPQRVLVNLAPADLKKEGSLYDLPIALGYLAEAKQIRFNPEGRLLAGELSLEGKLRPIKGVLSLALLAKEKNIKEIILPKENAAEASLACLTETDERNNLKVIGAGSLKEVINYLEGKTQISPCEINLKNLNQEPSYRLDFGWIKGQETAKRAMEIAAAGGHNLFLQGPPGAGKSLLISSLPSILPALTFEESLEVTTIYSLAGLLPKETPFLNKRPFRSPHHTSSETALIGGGNPPMPGEITLAHRGFCF